MSAVVTLDHHVPCKERTHLRVAAPPVLVQGTQLQEEHLRKLPGLMFRSLSCPWRQSEGGAAGQSEARVPRQTAVGSVIHRPSYSTSRSHFLSYNFLLCIGSPCKGVFKNGMEKRNES